MEVVEAHTEAAMLPRVTSSCAERAKHGEVSFIEKIREDGETTHGSRQMFLFVSEASGGSLGSSTAVRFLP